VSTWQDTKHIHQALMLIYVISIYYVPVCVRNSWWRPAKSLGHLTDVWGCGAGSVHVMLQTALSREICEELKICYLTHRWHTASPYKDQSVNAVWGKNVFWESYEMHDRTHAHTHTHTLCGQNVISYNVKVVGTYRNHCALKARLHLEDYRNLNDVRRVLNLTGTEINLQACQTA
jgi:hypothetical protein